MSNSNRISNDVFGLVIGLVISVLWIFMGLDFGFTFEAPDYVCYVLTLGGLRHTVMSIIALLLIPVCIREYRWGFLAAIVLGIITLILIVSHVLYFLIFAPSGFQSQIVGPFIWIFFQIPIVVFGYRAHKASVSS